MSDFFYLADNAVVTADVTIEAEANLWFHTVVRGDVAPIRICKRVNLQDSCVVHCDHNQEQVIEEGVVAGHRALLHGKVVGQDTLVGMGAILLGGSIIGKECLIAAGSVVRENAVIPARSLVAGVPGKIIRQLSDEEVKRTRTICQGYLELAIAYHLGKYPGVNECGMARVKAPWNLSSPGRNFA